MWPWLYSVVGFGGWRNRPLLSPIAHGHHRLVFAQFQYCCDAEAE
jgi:hypothetical protein